MPKVSVVIPTYNRAHLIRRAVQSVFDQNWRDLEVIIVDDGSIDGTVDVVRELQASSELPFRVEVLPKNLGVSAARNRGIMIAEGEFVAFLDSDDIWKPEKLEKQIDFLSKNKDHIGVSTSIELIKKNNETEVFHRNTTPITEENEVFKMLYQCYVITSSFVVRRDALILAGLFDIRLKSSEDRDLFWRLMGLGRIGYIHEPLIGYLVHDENLSNEFSSATAKNYLPALMKSIWYWRDHLSKDQINKIMAKSYLLFAYDAASAKNRLEGIKFALRAIGYRHLVNSATRFIFFTVLQMVRGR